MMNHLDAPVAFLGPIGGPELIMILMVLAVLVGIPVIVLVVLALNRPGNMPPAVTMAPPLPPSTGPLAKLQELETLKAQGLITQEEYAAKREKIIGEV
ncbi:SHOCT domain-containing protein [Luteolibacter sp. SL250]|uniref:SHOCT domain-containing protein n=1 Tax=Luteolibacter sp. SL250 TaxID=2995170 RepID=UPI002270DC5A|nr:SHOCT domain-containing protein [Luteolibacter sp. SL250]WAC21364.1 SHOCT domain-containing protein [Luteolibacter sp. SL250]